MKKLLSILITAIMLISCLSMFAYAEDDDTAVLTIGASEPGDLPFELVPPANVTASWLEGGDSPTTTNLSYGLSNEMTSFFKEIDEASSNGKFEEFMADYPFDDIFITTQMDWALDDVDDPVSGWHYNEYWDNSENYGFGCDEDGNYRFSEWDVVDWSVGNWTETVNEYWVTRGVPNDDRWNGNPDTKTPGVKDQLNPDQYTYDEENGELRIDFTEHTMYYRMRFVVTTVAYPDEGEVISRYYSDWSNIASVGKDAEAFEPLTEKDLKAPEITDLRMTDEDFNGCPVVAYTLTVPDELAENATKLAAAGGGIAIETEARVKGDSEWIQMQNAESTVKAGEMGCPLIHLVNDEHPTIDKDTEIELRCRYRCSQAGLDDIYSGYSEVITFKTDEFGGGDDTVPTDTAEDIAPVDTEPVKDGEKAEDKCPICHFCPRPLGLCIFVWIAIIAVVIVVVIVVIKVAKKSKK